MVVEGRWLAPEVTSHRWARRPSASEGVLEDETRASVRISVKPHLQVQVKGWDTESDPDIQRSSCYSLLFVAMPEPLAALRTGWFKG